MKRHHLLLLFILISPTLNAESTTPKNKLFEMLRLFYLPFKIDLQLGEEKDEIIPSVEKTKGGESTVLTLDDMQKLDKQWAQIRSTWQSRSLFRDTKVDLNGTVKISPHFISHRIAATRGALDSIPIEDRIRIKDLLNGKPKDVQAAVLQKRFLRTFIDPNTLDKPHFFIVAPDWCASSEGYRTILEWYTRKLAMGTYILHSIIIEDPRESIFDSKAMTDLFPFPKKYSHESVPRFLLADPKGGELSVFEEGAALQWLYDNHLSNHQGFLSSDDSYSTTLSKISSR